MKKILPIIALIGAGSLVAIGSNNMDTKKENFINNFKSFQEDLSAYTSLNEKSLTKTAFNKYNLSILSDNLMDLDNVKNSVETLNNENSSENNDNEISDTTIEENENIDQEIDKSSGTIENEEEKTDNLNDTIEQENEEVQKISTLYSLSGDIEESCDDFCELKEELTEAIVETQNLINKVQSKELELTKEQRMFITEQSMQLKNLGRQLSNITTELSFHLSDLNQVMTANSQDIDALNLKYLVVLDNLVNGNEMLQSSLSSLNLINQMFNTRSALPPNNQGRILYGFQHNDNPPVVKDYYIDENGELIDNSQSEDIEENNQQEANNNDNAVEVENESKTNIDTYQNRALKTNIDSYYNNNTPRNIDSFFNTALLDNEFMYGNGAYGYGGMYGQMNPNMQNYANYEYNNAKNSGHTANNTQEIEQNKQTQDETSQQKKEKKRIKLKKNIDTYKDENEPDIKTKLGNIKNSITGFFEKFKRPELKADLNEKIDNPIYRYDAKK